MEPDRLPKKSALQRCIGAIRPETWEKINHALLGVAKEENIERGQTVRFDNTVTETPSRLRRTARCWLMGFA